MLFKKKNELYLISIEYLCIFREYSEYKKEKKNNDWTQKKNHKNLQYANKAMIEKVHAAV